MSTRGRIPPHPSAERIAQEAATARFCPSGCPGWPGHGGLRDQGDSQGVLAAFALLFRTYICTYLPVTDTKRQNSGVMTEIARWLCTTVTMFYIELVCFQQVSNVSGRYMIAATEQGLGFGQGGGNWGVGCLIPVSP